MKFAVKKVATLVKGLSQAMFVPEGMSASALGAPVPFSRTLSSSMTGDMFINVGKGAIDPIKYSALFLQFAYSNSIAMPALATQFYDYVGTAARNPGLWRALAGFITGGSNRLIAADKLGQIPPDMVLNEIRARLPAQHDVFEYVLTDFVVGVLAPLGLVYGATSFVARINRMPAYPDYQAFVDVVATRQLKDVLTALANVDVTQLKRQISDKKHVNPALMAQTLNNAAITAWDRSRGHYMPEDITAAVFTALGRAWDTTLSGGAELSARVRNAAGFEELYSNLGIFLAYQDMCRTAAASPALVAGLGARFSDEEMATVILPYFREAIAEVSPFKLRPLADAVAMVGMMVSRRHDGFPALNVVYEDWQSPDECIAFVPVAVSPKGKERFLDQDVRITERLSMGMSPAMKMFGVPAFAASRKSTHDLMPAHSRLTSAGTEMVLGLPSFFEREIAFGEDASSMQQLLKDGVVLVGENATSRRQAWAAFSAYAHMVHVAVARTGAARVEVAAIPSVNRSEERPLSTLFLRWAMLTQHKESIGSAAVYQGEAVVTEPLEAIAYAEDFAPSAQLRVEVPPLAEFQNMVHVWDFRPSSARVEFTSTYVTSVRNKSLVASISQKEILGIGADRPRLLFMRSPVGRAITSMWVEWFKEDLAAVRKGQKTGDPALQATYVGAEMAMALDVLTRLVSLGASGLGANIAASVTAQLRDALVGQGHIDDTSDLVVGVQRIAVQMYAGITTLELLNLMEASESATLRNLIQTTRAVSTWVAANASRA